MFGGFEGNIRQFRTVRKRKTGPATAHSLAIPRAGLAGFAAAPGARFGSFGVFGGFEGRIRQFRTGRKRRLDLLQLIVWQFQELVWQVSRQLQGPDLEVSERLEGLKEESGSIGPVAKEKI